MKNIDQLLEKIKVIKQSPPLGDNIFEAEQIAGRFALNEAEGYNGDAEQRIKNVIAALVQAGAEIHAEVALRAALIYKAKGAKKVKLIRD